MKKRIPFTVAILSYIFIVVGCAETSTTNEPPPTLDQAVDTLREHEKVISKALRAKNPSAADEAMHDAMYLADHLHEFTSESEIDLALLEEESARLLALLLKAHQNAHGSDEESAEPESLASQISECVTKLEGFLK